MDFDKRGDASVQVMALVAQLEGKVREKNEVIKELWDQYTETIELLLKVGEIVGSYEPTEIPEMVSAMRRRLEEQCHMWRTKFILSTMLNWANPIPLVTGSLVGGGLGWWITWLVMRHK